MALEEQDMDKKRKFLELGIRTFNKSGKTDDDAFRIIMATLMTLPLYVPVEIDIDSMLKQINPHELNPGDMLQPKNDVRMVIRTMNLQDGNTIVPLFSSCEQARRGPETSVIRMYPEDCFNKLLEMNMDAILNPFDENGDFFILGKEFVKQILLPMLEKSKQN